MTPPLPILPTTVIGSYSMPEWLERAKNEYLSRRLSRRDLDEMHDAVRKAAIKDQETAGIDIVSDGEAQRDNMIDYFTERMPGVQVDLGSKRFYYDFYESIVRSKLATGTLGLSEEEVLALLAKMLAEGRIRRIGAVIRHRRLGYEANAMAVWDVPDAQVGEIGRALGRDPCVTLCYRRARALPHWRYNLYCMVHGKQRGQVLRQLAQMDAVRPFPGEVLFSTRCFSQRAARYG